MSDTSILSTVNLAVGYGKKKILSGIDFSIKQGKITVLIGPNGCGKSTVLKTITRQLESLSGTIYIDGKNMRNMKDSECAKLTSMVMTGKVSPELMTCKDVIATGRYPYTGMLGILSEDDEKKVSEAIRLFRLEEIAEADFNRISDGQRQRVMLARSVCQEPKVLILDEPTTFLDIKYKMDILSAIKNLAVSRNVAVIMSLHELEYVQKIADEVIAIDADGNIHIDTPSNTLIPDNIKSLYGISDNGAVYSDLLQMYSLHNSEKDRSENTNLNVHINDKKIKAIMVQGTMSGVGKSLIVAGLCRIFAEDGYKVAPFKSQNMALNSYITKDGLEMGRAQVMQAECARIEPSVLMNPILLKPTDDCGSQVIVEGKVVGNMRAKEYFEYKKQLIPNIMHAYEELSKNVDIIVIEGAGSPAEINLKSNDIVNMGLAKLVDAPVLLVGDIDRGGVFAQLLGTINLLEEDELERVKGLIVNKFRGDKSILDPGIDILEDRSGINVVGVTPYMNINLEDEDSLSDRFNNKGNASFEIAVIRYPHISNFTDFNVFEQIESVVVKYVTSVRQLENPDIIILPGTKNTIDDLRWLKESGIDVVIDSFAKKGTVIFGICGGYQMLGEKISDPHNVEAGGVELGLNLLPVETVLNSEKNQNQYSGRVVGTSDIFDSLKGFDITGYEIHMGETTPVADNRAGNLIAFTESGSGYCMNNIYGSYVHGLFDRKDIAMTIVEDVAKMHGKNITCHKIMDYAEYKESQYVKLADTLREYLDMDEIYRIIGCER